MQTITFTAASGGELRQQMLDFLGIVAAPQVFMREQPVHIADAADAADAVKPADTADVKTKAKSRGQIKEKLVGDLPPPGTGAEKVEPEPQGSRAPEPETALQAPIKSDELIVTEPLPEPEPEFVEQAVVTPPKEALELKEKVIDALQAAFRAGKVQKVRSVLTQYGNGAKSFREIDIAAFPDIDKALQHGALN